MILPFNLAQFFFKFSFNRNIKQCKWSNYLDFPIVDQGYLDKNEIFPKKETMV
jgi:hypothetical protein